MKINRGFLVVMSVMLFVLAFGSPCQAAQAAGHDESAGSEPAGKSALATGLIALAAALSVGVCALATGIAQSRIGAAGCGAIAEKPEVSGTVIVLVAIPETMVILGFVIGVVLIFTQ